MILITPTVETYLGTVQKYQEWVPPTTDAAYASLIIPSFFNFFCGVLGHFLTYFLTSAVGIYLNGPKPPALETSIRLWCLVKISGQLKPQMRSQGHFISVRGQKIFYWKLGRDCHFGSNGPICIFNLIFFVHLFVVFRFVFYFSFFFFLILFYFLYFIYLLSDWQQWATIDY